MQTTNFVVTGLLVGLAVGVAYAGASLLLWEALPFVVTLTATDRTALGTPLAVLPSGRGTACRRGLPRGADDAPLAMTLYPKDPS